MATINKIQIGSENYDIVSLLAEEKIQLLTERIDSIGSNDGSNSNTSNIIVDDGNLLLIGTDVTLNSSIAYFGPSYNGISLSKDIQYGDCDISIGKNPYFFLTIGSDSERIRIGIGDETRISDNVNIGSDVSIKSNVSILCDTEIKNNVSIGNYTKIEDRISIGSCRNELTDNYDVSLKIYQDGEGIIIPRGLEIGEEDNCLIIKTKRNTYRIQPS